LRLRPSAARLEGVTLSRDQIVHALERLDEGLGARGISASLYLVGGAVMCLALNERETTKDVDAWFTEPEAVRAVARGVAEELGLPDDWLNDAAKAFIPQGAGFELWRAFPYVEVLVADAATMFAMKCAAARTEEDSSDIRALAKKLGISTAAEALSTVLRYYPAEHLPVRSRLLLEEMFDDGG
jgi:hypothetical protein